MSPTLYTAKNNGGDDNGVSTTMVIATTMANNGIRFGDIRSTFPSSCYGAVLEPYKSSRQRQARSRLFYRRCGGTYGVLHGRNVSGVVGRRYSVCEEGRNERPLTTSPSSVPPGLVWSMSIAGLSKMISGDTGSVSFLVNFCCRVLS